jgi:Sec-independent protein secretion pathway component TatC
MIAVSLELCGVSALPVAVGMYIPLAATLPIFIGGLVRLVADRLRGKPKSDAESETSGGVLLASGYIAGGTLCGLIVAFFTFLPDSFNEAINLGYQFFAYDEGGKKVWNPDEVVNAKLAAVAVFGVLMAILLWVGARKEKPPTA